MSLGRATFFSIKCALGSLSVSNFTSVLSGGVCIANIYLVLPMTIVFLVVSVPLHTDQMFQLRRTLLRLFFISRGIFNIVFSEALHNENVIIRQ